MASLSVCLSKAMSGLTKEDVADVKAAYKDFMDDNYPGGEAAVLAAKAVLEQAIADRNEIVRQIVAAGGVAPDMPDLLPIVRKTLEDSKEEAPKQAEADKPYELAKDPKTFEAYVKGEQTSLVPEATTKEKIAAESKAKEGRGGNEPMDEGLFGSSKDQLDLVDMAKQPKKEAADEKADSQDQEKQTGDTPDSEAYETLADIKKAVADGKVKSQPDREHRCYKFAGQKALDGGYDLVLGKVGDEKIQHGVARTLDEKYIYDPQYDVWMAADVYAQAVSGFEEEFVLSASDVQTFLDDFNVWPSMAMLEKHGWLGGEAIEESAPATSVEEPVETSETEQESEETETKPQEAVSLQDALRDRLLGEGFATIIEARKFAKEHGFEGSTKDVDEIVEQAVVAAARQVASETGDAKSAYQALVDLYNNQPNLAVRTSTSVTNQAYSTPAPLAYLASRLAGVADASHVLEPTAGNGMLLIEADPNTVEANEIDPKRAKALRDQNFATVKSVDATEPSLARDKSADSVIMNPPFGAVREDGQSKSWTVDGLETSAIDHAIALNALHAMTDDGKAVIIMGGVNAENIEERRKGYRGQSKRLFFAKLYKTYNVTDHFTVSGDLYKKQGAGWPVDVVVIEGRGQSERPLPASEPPAILKTWDDLKGKLPDVGTSKKPARGPKQAPDADNRPAGGADLGKRGAKGGDVSGRPNAGTSGTERLPAGTKDKPADLRADRDRGQPYDVSKGVGNEPDTAAQSVRDRRAANERPASSRKPRVERTAPPEGSGQALYEPASAAQSLDTLIPVNMAQATKSALSRVEARHGSLDAFVADRLGYTDDLSKYFSAEQVDAIATAIDNIERGSGYILGDQCVGGETLILDPATGDHTPIQVLTERGQPISVLSLTNDGFARRPATAPFLKGVADLYRVTFDDESSITVTRGHRFLTSNGWASLDAGVEVGTEIVASLPADLQNYTSHRRVVAIQFDRHDAFFDMHVPGTFNYVANGVVNHNTGIGKGRVVAATIRYAIRKGWTPVFVTEKPDLYGDMFRDMNDIGLHKMLGHEPRALMTNTGESVPLDEEALAWKQEADQARADGQPIPKRRGRFLTAGGKPAQEKAMQAMASGKGQHDIVFTTYDQMNTIKKQETDRRRFLRQIMPNSLLILDESHNAGGQGEKLFKAKHGDAPDRAEYVRGLVKGAAGVVYSSATFAKRPDVMDLYARTDMGKAVDDPKMLPALIQKGGVPMQQIVASMLSNAGQYMRRERSFEGVEYAVEPVPVDEKTYKQFSDAVRAVFEFDLAVEDIRDEVMEDILDQMGATKAKDAGVGGGSASSIAFASIMHNIVNQMLLSIKARQVAQRAIDAHKAGEKPVIALAGTMESFISDYAEDAGISIGQPIAISFGDVLQRYLSRTLRITVKDSDNQKKHVQIPISDLPPSLQRKYAEAEQLIKEGDFDSMPVSPIDAIRHELTSAGLSVAEVTGRKVMIDYGAKGNSAVLIDRPKSEIGPSGKRSSIAAFNRGGLDALILNRSGSTGVSMHASKAFKDQSPRRMIIAQAEANIDTHLQMLGRVHRTGQVIPPSYSQIAAEIPAEARPTAVLMKKMASLNANTTGARGSVFMADSIDFMNEYGDKVVANIIQDEPEINAKLGNPLKENDKGLPVSEDAARRVTGRLVLLTPKEQTELLNRIQDEYKAEIERLDALGENALEAKTVDLKARHIETTALKDRTGEGPFLDSAQIEKVSIKSQGRAMAPKEVAEKISEALEITTPEGEGAAQLAVLERSGREWMNKKIGDVRSRSQSWIASDVASKSDDAKVTTKKRHDDQLARWIQTAQVVAPGARVTLQLGDRQMHAIVLSVARTGKAKNPVALGAWTATMAVPDSVRTLTLPFSQLFPPSQVKGSEESGAEVRFSQVPFTGLISQLEDARREGREDRYIVTGNILAGYDQVHGKGQIVNFTMEDGTLRPGILMSRDFQLNKFMSARTVRFKTAAQVAAFLEKAPMAEVQTSDKYVTFSRPRGEYVIETAAGRATGGQYYTDTRVRDALQGREFVRSGGIMRVTMPDRSAFTRVLDAIRKVGGIFETTSDQDLAQEIIRQTSPLSALGGDHDPQAINNIERRLVVGREARIAPSAVQFALEAIKNDLKLAPANTIVAAVSKIATDAEHDGHVLITATKHDGKTVTARLPWDRVKDSRAIFIPGRRPTILHINFRTPPESARRVQEVGQVTGRGALDEVAEMRFALAESIRADFIHELTHLLRTTGVLTGSRWQRLLDHANSLQLLELDVNAPVSERIMLRELGVEPKQTLRDAYSGIYAHYSNAQEAVDQEAVAALREMAWLGLLSDEQLAPVRDILDEISDGNIRGLGFNESGGPAYAIGGRDIFDEIEDTIYAGKTYVIPYGRVVTQMEDARPHLNMVPKGTIVGVLERITPVGNSIDPLNQQVELRFMLPNGKFVTITHFWTSIADKRALTQRFGDRSGLFFLNPRGFLDSGKTLSGEIWHEVTHILRVPPLVASKVAKVDVGLVGDRWSRLLAHANKLQILDRVTADVLKIVGVKNAGGMSTTRTLRQDYSTAYHNRSDKVEIIRQESVAHMLELWHHGAISDEDMAPVMDIIEDIRSGRLAGNPAFESSSDPTYAIGKSQSDQDSLGYYSKLLRAAYNLKQEKGTPEQMLAQLKDVKESEIEATGLRAFLEGKKAVTKSEIINYLSENRVELQEKVYLTPKWANLSVDPNNPTYQETVLHLPSNTDQGVEIPNTAGGWGNIDLNGETMRNPEYDRVNFTSGHWSEPNVVAHTRTQILTDANGHKVFNIDELQSDWGQAVRDRETKTPPISHPLVNTTDQWTTTAVRRLVKQAVESGADAISFTPGRVQAARFNLAKNVRSLEYDPTKKSLYIEPTSGNPFERDVKWLRSPKDLEQYVGKEAAKMLLAEPLGTNGAKPTAHKIVFKEGQVVGGDGMKATYDVMYPRLLGKLLAKMDPSIKAEKTNLFKHDGNPVRAPLPVKEVVAMGLSSPPAEDFTAFPITDKVRSQVLNDGQPLFAISGRPKNEDPVVGYLRWAQDLKPATLSITDKVGRSYRFERQPVGNGAIYYRAFDGSKQIASFYVRTGGSVFDSISVMNAMVEKPYRRLGIASAAYDAIEADTAPGGLPLYPQGTLSMSQDAKAFWETRNPERLREMERAELDRYSWSAAQLYQSKIDNTAKANVETAIKDALEIVGRIAGRNINVDLKPTIPVGAALDASSRADLEASGQDLPETAGGYYKTVRNGTTGVVEGPHVIGLAFDDPRFDLRTTAGHEAWHHVETVLSTPQEMRLLQSPAEMARMTRLAAKEAGRSTAETSRLPAYEIRALAFQNYRRMREEGAAELSGLHIGVRRFFERIAKTLAAIRNALKGMGYASFEDIFERARTGETAAKAEQQEAETKEQQLEQAVKSAMQSSSNNNPDPAATINAFIDQRMARDDGSAASQVQAYHAYSLWADEAGLELPTIEEFDKAMRRQGVRRMMLAGDVRYVGLRVVEEAEEKPANPSAKIEKDAFQIAKELALGMSIEGAIEKQIEKVKSVIGEKPDFARLALLQTLKANDNANEKIHENIISMGNVMPSNPLRGTLHRRALRMLARVANISDAARVRIQDKALPIRRLAVERVENETGAAVPVSLDTYISEGLYHGRAGERLNDLKEDRIEPLLEHMRASGLTLDAVGDYLYARHAFERNDAIRQIDPNNDAGSGMTDEEAQATLDRVYQSGKQADMDTAVRMVDTIIDDARNTLLRSGLIDRTTYDKWREKYPNYVPLRGFDLGEDENPDRPRAGRGFDLRGAESKQALGRRSKSDNPLVYTIMQAEEAIIRAEKNRVAKTLYRMIQANPNPAVWELYRGEAKRRVNPSTGLVETYWVRPPFVHNDAVHGVKFNGKQFWMELKHPALARAMRGVGSEWNGSIIGRAMMTLTRTYASLLTSYNPEFVVSNFFRDLETSLMNVSDVANKPAGLRRQILKDATSLKSIRGALAAVRDHEGRTIFGTHRRADENILGLPKSAAAQEYARWYDEFRLAGGKISFMEFNDVERIKHRINADLKAGRMKRALRGAAEYVENLNTAVENGVRLSTYVALRRAGVEQDRAAFTARELTVNFNRRGEWGPAINSMYLFFNASVQGSTRVAQAFVRSKAVRYGVASIFAAGMALDLFNFLAAGDGDDGENKYDAIPDWIKERNVIIMNPFGDDYIMIPMAYGYNVPYVAGLKATEMVRGKTSPLQAAASVTGQVVDSFNPMGTAERFYQLVSPTIIDPAVQVLENKTWYGGPIYPTKYDKRKPESENYFTSAPWWAIDMAKTLNSVTGGNHRRSGWFDVSPEVIEHYAEFAGGGVAKFIGNAMNSGERLVNGDEWLPEKTPLLRRVYGKPTSEGRKRDFYELWDDADRARYESQSDDKEVAEAAREKYAPELRIYGAAKGAKNALKALRAQRDKIMADDKLDHAERQAKLNDILEREKALISRVLKLYRDAKAQQSEKETTP